MNNAKYAFYYLFSLVALVFVAIATGMVAFQIINQLIPDTIANYSDSANQEILRFAIASLVFATPVYYWMSKLIKDGLVSGDLDSDSGIRRWLTYLIIFAASVVMLVWLIITLNSFLNGELTMKVALKTLTIIIIAGSIFSYYLIDAKKVKVEAKDQVRLYFFIGSLTLVSIAFIASWFFVDAPAKVRGQRHDTDVVNHLNQIQYGVQQYYDLEKRLPVSLAELKANNSVGLDPLTLTDPITKAPHDYKVINATSFEVCADFTFSTDDQSRPNYYYSTERHQSGHQCFKKVVTDNNPKAVPMK